MIDADGAVAKGEKDDSGNGRQGGGGRRTPLKKRSVTRIKRTQTPGCTWSGGIYRNSSSHLLHSKVDADSPGASKYDGFVHVATPPNGQTPQAPTWRWRLSQIC